MKGTLRAIFSKQLRNLVRIFRFFLGLVDSMGSFSREKELAIEFKLCWPIERGAWPGKDIATEIVVDGEARKPRGFWLW